MFGGGSLLIRFAVVTQRKRYRGTRTWQDDSVVPQIWLAPVNEWSTLPVLWVPRLPLLPHSGRGANRGTTGEMRPFFTRDTIGFFFGAWVIGAIIVASVAEGSTGNRVLVAIGGGAFVGLSLYGSLWAYEFWKPRPGDEDD